MSKESKRVQSGHEPVMHEVITPIALESENSENHLSARYRIFIISVIALIMLVLLFSIVFVFTARTLIVQISPTPDHLTLQGGLFRLPYKDRYLLQSGKYRLKAVKNGYYPIDESIEIGMTRHNRVQHVMQKRPGLVSIQTNDDSPARVYIDRKYVGVTPLFDIELSAGQHSVELQRYRYRAMLSQIQVQGASQKQRFDFALVPNWSVVRIDSKPSDAPVWINGEKIGETPAELELDAGTHQLEIVHVDYAAYVADFVVLANQDLDLGQIALNVEPSFLLIQTEPRGASVSINDINKGLSPVSLQVMPNQALRIDLNLAGYRSATRVVEVKTGQSDQLSMQLQPILGVIDLRVTPENATVAVDGKVIGRGAQRLTLTTTDHQIEVSESGYETQVFTVKPPTDKPKTVNANLILRTSHQGNQSFSAQISSATGQRLTLIRPNSFTMGSSRGEQGRRANESLREVEMKRAFYIGIHEVTKEQFARFDPNHQSSEYRGVNLQESSVPVVNVSWQQAAEYCNWLSKQENLPLEYREQNGELLAKSVFTTGYRLPTEAEWAWVARMERQQPTRYSWGNEYPPTEVVANLADRSASRIVGLTIPKYDDGYVGLAPVGSFKPNRFGVFDLDGNAAEWVNDYYTIYVSRLDQRPLDPRGPPSGKHHVVRGGSWLRGTLANTRLAYRDYRSQAQPDVGFRIARYAE